MSLGLSAFVYVPFGESVTRYMQNTLFSGSAKTGSLAATIADIFNGSAVNSQAFVSSFKAETLANIGASINNVRQKLNPTRLRDQMFAYTVTNQIVNSFTEVGLPYLMRFVSAYRNRHEKNNSKLGSPSGEPKKRVVFEDEKERWDGGKGVFG
jgi:anoctamin-10